MLEPILILLLPIINAYVWIFRAFILSVWHVLADIVTRRYAGLNGSTIRVNYDSKDAILGGSLADNAPVSSKFSHNCKGFDTATLCKYCIDRFGTQCDIGIILRQFRGYYL
jgi:hypothetical protein